MASRPGDGHLIQSDSPREYRWWAPREIPGVCSSWPLRQPVPHQRIRPRARPLPGELHQQSWWVECTHQLNVCSPSDSEGERQSCWVSGNVWLCRGTYSPFIFIEVLAAIHIHCRVSCIDPAEGDSRSFETYGHLLLAKILLFCPSYVSGGDAWWTHKAEHRCLTRWRSGSSHWLTGMLSRRFYVRCKIYGKVNQILRMFSRNYCIFAFGSDVLLVYKHVQFLWTKSTISRWSFFRTVLVDK